jgi:hypothetical protein
MNNVINPLEFQLVLNQVLKELDKSLFILIASIKIIMSCTYDFDSYLSVIFKHFISVIENLEFRNGLPFYVIFVCSKLYHYKI